jgi:heme-degrading monooxygenase HmoA
MSGRVIRMSQRFVLPMMEFRVQEIMNRAEAKIRAQPGLERVETLVDRNDPNRYVVITEWASRGQLNTWLASAWRASRQCAPD